MNQKRKPNRLAEFFSDKGFYIILILCVAAIGISGYVLFFSGAPEGDDNPSLAAIPTWSPPATERPTEMPLIGDIPDALKPRDDVVMATPSPDPTAGPGAVAVMGQAEPEPTFEPEPTPEPTLKPADLFVRPLNGEVARHYSVDALVFSATMGDWRVHTGVDIAANLGTHVLAIADGVVEDIYEDEDMGVTIVIDHGGNMKSVYRNLMDSPPVTVTQPVSAGDVIGGVGQSASLECDDPPHLHLEVVKDGERLDPLSILP